jgi:crotonobetainyl-CoA:carnitine CoA-transferase CaiB-like acyl-CoA transferase
MASDNIFSGLKVVDFASFLAGPSAAVILSDFGADVVKVEPPAGDFWRVVHKVPPQPQAKDAYRLIYADLTGFGDKGPDATLPGFDLTSYWARSGLLSMTRDAGAPPTWPVAGSGDIVTAAGLYSAIVTALYHREHSGKGSYVTTSLLAEGVWSASVSIQAALCEATFFPLHDRRHPANCSTERLPGF